MLKPVKRTSVSEAVIAEIRDAIARGDLKPGDKLPPERDLAASLGVSRLAMREGLKVLAAMGLVEARQGDGTFIARPTAQRLLDPLVGTLAETALLLELSEARTVLEVEIAGLAARRANAGQQERMAASLAQMEGALVAGECHLAADLDFHQTLVAAAENQVLAQIYANISDLIDRLRLWTHQVDGSGARALECHRQIFAAIAAREEAQARHAMRIHMQNVLDDLEQVMKQRLAKEAE